MEQKVNHTKTVRTDIHNHLRTSSHITPEISNLAIEAAGRRLGRRGIFGVVNFDSSPTKYDKRWALFVKGAKEEKINTGNGVYFPDSDILAIKGQEVPAREGYHILLIGVPDGAHINNGSPLDDILDFADKEGIIKIADHPFHKSGIGPFLDAHPEYISRFDGYETFNGEAEFTLFRRYPNANLKAQEWLESKRYLPGAPFRLVSSDGHSISELGRSYTEIQMVSDYSIFKESPLELNKSLIDSFDYADFARKNVTASSSVSGAMNHAGDLALLVAAEKILGWDPNEKTAPALERLGLYI